MKFVAGLCLVLASAPIAAAQISEVRIGLAEHDIRVIGNLEPVEESVAVNAEIIFDEPEFLKWALSPQPYIGGTLNVGGGTSYGGAGLMWRQNLGDKFYGDFAFGLVVHDGTNQSEISDDLKRAISDLDPNSPIPLAVTAGLNEFFFRRNKTIQYGSRVLFRQQLTLGYRIDPKWAVEGFFEHISHAKVLSDGPNDGSDAAGFRVNRRF